MILTAEYKDWEPIDTSAAEAVEIAYKSNQIVHFVSHGFKFIIFPDTATPKQEIINKVISHYGAINFMRHVTYHKSGL